MGFYGGLMGFHGGLMEFYGISWNVSDMGFGFHGI